MTRVGCAALLAFTLAASLMAGSPALAAPQVVEGTIAAPGGNVANAQIGYLEVAGDTPTRQMCPGPGDLDGVMYKFFDLKGLYKNFKLTGPKPAVQRETPVGTYNEYDIDIHGFDAKCNRIEGGSGVDGRSPAGSEVFRPKKPVRYIVVKYYQGVYPNIPIRVEYS